MKDSIDAIMTKGDNFNVVIKGGKPHLFIDTEF